MNAEPQVWDQLESQLCTELDSYSVYEKRARSTSLSCPMDSAFIRQRSLL